MRKEYPTLIHSSCMTFETIYVSAGIRGLQLKIAPTDLIRYVKAIVTEII